jgi:Proteasome subunit
VTLIVGIRCSDGVVLGADGAATLGAMGAQTAQQKTVKKLSILKRKIVVGVSGPVGIGQRVRALIEDEYDAGVYKDKRPEDVMTLMRNKFWSGVVGPEWACASATAGVVGGHIAATSANGSILVALPLRAKAELIQFDHQCAPEMATAELPFVAIGGGQGIADPFLAFIRRIFWPTGCPSISDALFSTIWTLRHAIETNPGGVADPMQIVVLEKKGGDWEARELTQPEIEQHIEAIADAESSLKKWRSQLSSAPSGASPQQPPLTAA